MFVYYPPAGMRHGFQSIAKSSFGNHCGIFQVRRSESFEYYFLDSGKSAIRLVLEAMHEQKPNKDEVILPAYTCYSVAAAVKESGLNIRLVDIDKENLNYQSDKLQQAIGDNTLAVIFTSFFSLPIQNSLFDDVAGSISDRPYILLDLAQSYYVEEQKYKTDASIYSFGRGKPVNAEGGGVLGVSCIELKKRIRMKYGSLPIDGKKTVAKQILKAILNDFFLPPYLYWIPANIKYLKLGVTEFPVKIKPQKMTRFQKNLLSYMEEKTPELKLSRWKKAEFYRKSLIGKKQPFVPDRYAPVRYPVYLDGEKIDVRKAEELKKYGIAKMYPKALSKLNEIKQCCVNNDDVFVQSEWMARNLYTLPVHEFVTTKHQKTVLRLVSPLLV